MADVDLKIGSDGPHPVAEEDYIDPDGVVRREDIEAMIAAESSGLTMAQTIVTDVGVFNGALKKKTRILTFTNGRLTSVSTETAWS